jgi:hypothetical protein
MIVFKRFTDIDYIAMGKTDVWEIKKAAEMVTWFAFQERAQLEDLEEAVIFEDGEFEKGGSRYKNPESQAFGEVLNKVLQFFERFYVDPYIEHIQRLEMKDLMDGRIINNEPCARKASVLEFLEEQFRDIDVAKLRRLLEGEEVSGRKDKITETLVDAYRGEAEQSVVATSMAEIRHKKAARFKDALQTRIDDYFTGGCQCTSKTAFEQLKKQWPNEEAMKVDVKVGYYTLKERIKATLAELETEDPEKIVRRCQAKGYRKEKVPVSCPRHRITNLK